MRRLKPGGRRAAFCQWQAVATTEAQPLSRIDAKDIYIDKRLVENGSHYSGICRERPVS